MVKDYKRLHHLDFADADLDDSDGGYSDYQMSEHEAEDPPEKTDSKELLPGLYQWQSTCPGFNSWLKCRFISFSDIPQIYAWILTFYRRPFTLTS
jgi:hypothetical protein